MKLKMFRRVGYVALLIALLVPVLASAATDFDGSRELLCAVIHATEAEAEIPECLSGPPWLVNLPVFIEIDFVAKQTTTTSQHQVQRSSEIEVIDHLGRNRMSLQGTDGEYSWSMLISEETGSMTLAVAGEEVGFLVFGACTPR